MDSFPHIINFMTFWLVLLNVNDVTSSQCTKYIDECSCADKTLNCSRKFLSDVPGFQHYTGNVYIKSVLLNNNEIRILRKQAFKGLTVESIDLSNNPISQMSNHAFSDMESVQELYMNNCPLKTVHPAIAPMKYLTVLSLANISVTNLRKSDFEAFKNLRSLNLANNSVQFISAMDAFDSLQHLESLDLSGNNLYSLPRPVLKGLLSLKTLHLENNHMTTLTNETFHDVRNLTKLYLQNNPLKFTGDNSLFNKLIKLVVLKISHCNGDRFDRQFLDGKSHLKSLTVSHCSFGSVDSDVFDDVIENIVALDISGSLGLYDAFRKSVAKRRPRNIEQLFLASLNLTHVPSPLLKGLHDLILLDLSCNQIERLQPGAFDGMNSINVHLNLKNNKIHSVSPFIFKGMSPPVSVYLNGNRLKNMNFITEYPCNFDRSTIDLTGNDIRCDCTIPEVLQKQLVTLLGTCKNSSFDEEDPDLHLSFVDTEPEGVYRNANFGHCFLEDRIGQKYDCCHDKWVPTEAPITCAVTLASSEGIKTKLYSFYWILIVFIKVISMF